MGLDIATPKGQRTLVQEARAVEIFLRHHPEYVYAETPKDRPGAVDALLVKDGMVKCVVEQKSRDLTVDTLRSWNWEWLVTAEKIRVASTIAKALCVPFVGFLYLVPEDALLVQRITNADGSAAVQMRTDLRETQATVNGGVAVRQNAMIDMSGARWFTMHESLSLGGRDAERRG